MNTPPFLVGNEQTIWFPYLITQLYSGSISWLPQFKSALLADINYGTVDEAFHYTVGNVIYYQNHPPGYTLQTVPVTGFTDNGSGSYTISWNVPAGATSYRVKWGQKQIVDWIGFNAGTYSWIGNPATQQNWFASTDATGIPAPSGSTQSFTIATGATGLSAANFMVKAYSSGCTIAPLALGPWTAGQTINQTLTSSSCSASTWAVSAGSLPSGLSVNSSTGAITGTISAAGTWTPTISYDGGSQTYSIIVNPAPAVTSNSLAPATSTENYSAAVSTSGGTGAITCSADGGLSGSGLAVASNCLVTGTASTAGSYTVGVTPADSNGVSGSAHAIAVTINAVPSINTTSLPNGTLGVPYNQTLSMSGGTAALACSISAGSLPGGLNLNGSNCNISGTPSGGGISEFTTKVTDANSISATQALSINVVLPGVSGPPPFPDSAVCTGCRF